jgi:hypothetical protein
VGDGEYLGLFATHAVNHGVTEMFELAAPEVGAKRVPGKRLLADTRQRLIHIGGESIAKAGLPKLQLP